MQKRPNILLITSDQQHWNTLGVLNGEVKTPNLDRLAKMGTTYTRAYCPNPTCTPTRASIITGQYPSQHGAWSLGTKLSEATRTVGDVFSEDGYRTALIGKAHFQPLASTEDFPSLESYPILQDLDYWKAFNGRFYGFEHCELARNHTNEAHVGQHYALWLEEKGCKNWRDYFLAPTGTMDPGKRHRWDIPEEYHYDAWIAERVNFRLASYKANNDPFFLWASFFDPHPAYFAPSPWDTMYDPQSISVPSVTPGEHELNPPHFGETQKIKTDFSSYAESGFYMHGFHSHVHDPEKLRKDIAVYYGMISLMDKYIGKILDQLDELGLSDNTIVVFTCDHGHFYGHHGLTAKGPFHYEDMIKVPFIVKCPGKEPQQRFSDSLQSLVDLAPTFLSLCGMKIPRTMTGVDQSFVWEGRQRSVRNHILCENHHEPSSIHLKTYVDDRYKITVYYNHEFGELFDLHTDPGEVHNLWNDPSYAQLKSELLLKYIWAELGKEPMWMPRIWGA